MTGIKKQPPVAANTIYATKPAGWSQMYAYVYTGDGATAVNNAAWPGEKMEVADNCDQSGYKYEVPDSLAKGAKVIFNDGGTQQFPGSRQPGLDYAGGTVSWDGSSTALTAITCDTTVPVSSVSISGDGVSNGKLSLKAGASAQLTATVKPDNATDRKVTWTSSDSSVANVMGTGVVTAGRKAGTATITASAGGRSASVRVSVTVPNETVDITFEASGVALKAGETLYAVGDWGQANAWSRNSGVRLAKSGNMYTGTAKVDKNHAMAFRLIKVDASGRTTWDPAKDRKATADRTKSLGVAWNVSTVNEDGVPPVSLSITGAGVKDGELSLSAGSLAQLSVAGSSSKADMWWSDGAAVAVSGTGNVYAVQAGTAKVSAKVDGKTVSVTVTVK